MLEMIVRTVDHDPRFGRPVAMLLPRDPAAGVPLTLPLRPSEACALTHELEGQTTPRTRAYVLLNQALTAIGGSIAEIVMEPGDGGDPTARVRVRLADGWAEHRTDAASALGLAVFTMQPVLVSPHLARTPSGR